MRDKMREAKESTRVPSLFLQKKPDGQNVPCHYGTHSGIKNQSKLYIFFSLSLSLSPQLKIPQGSRVREHVSQYHSPGHSALSSFIWNGAARSQVFKSFILFIWHHLVESFYSASAASTSIKVRAASSKGGEFQVES